MPDIIPVLTGASLRDGISITLPCLSWIAERPALHAGTYTVVVFTMALQGPSPRAIVDGSVRK